MQGFRFEDGSLQELGATTAAVKSATSRCSVTGTIRRLLCLHPSPGRFPGEVQGTHQARAFIESRRYSTYRKHAFGYIWRTCSRGMYSVEYLGTSCFAVLVVLGKVLGYV